jgi:hypothetical protein
MEAIRNVRKEYMFEPAEEITAYELALIVRHCKQTTTGISKLVVFNDVYPDCWEQLKRHFRELPG